MPKCKGCGIELLEGTVFCPYCGQAVEETEKPAEPVQPEQNEQPEQPQFEQPQYGAPQYGQPQYGAPQYGQPQYGAPQYGQPQYGAPQYGQPYYGAPLPKRENKGATVCAIIGMVLGIITLVFTFLTMVGGAVDPFAGYALGIVGIEFALPGIILSSIGKKSYSNRGKAIFGLIVSIIGIVLMFILAVAFMVTAMEEGYDISDIYGYY
jgi:hypothetical protein